jgi:hypothetical protein
MAQHADARRKCAESRGRELPDNRVGLLNLPHHYGVGQRCVQSQRYRLPTDEFAPNGACGQGGAMYAVPRRWQLFIEHSANRLR